MPDQTGQYGTLPIATANSSGGGSTPSCSRIDARVVGVLLGGGGMGAAGAVQPQQRHLDVLRTRIDVQNSPGQADPALEVPSFDVVVTARSTISRYEA